MESFLIKSSICLVVLYLIYSLIFRDEKNHQLKRFIGLLCIAFACVFLFIPLGSLLVADTYPQIINVVYMQGSDGIQEGISQVVSVDFTNIFLTIYSVGVVFFGLRFLYGMGKLAYWYRTSEKTKQWGFKVVRVKENITPFTFFNVLFLNNDMTNGETMRSLIVHEQYHRDQFHSIDTVLLEMLAILFWFNPAIWLFKRDIKTVHEYLADAQVLKKGFDPLRYQYLLFQTKTAMVLPVANHFSDKTNLKKRITMMNEKNTQSKKSYVKALLFVPALALILVVSAFTQANDNLSNELKQFRLIQEKDTIPNQAKKKEETSQFAIRYAEDLMKKQPLIIVKEGKKEKTITYKAFRKYDYNKIATINVLKDAAAKKKYGKRGENGVVIIELKKKKDEK